MSSRQTEDCHCAGEPVTAVPAVAGTAAAFAEPSGTDGGAHPAASTITDTAAAHTTPAATPFVVSLMSCFVHPSACLFARDRRERHGATEGRSTRLDGVVINRDGAAPEPLRFGHS
jgi:hypothetical protein